jgi:outer membrane immunogenic protein
MNTRLLSVVTAAITIGAIHTASAADLPAPMPMKAPAPVMYVPPTWTGCYIGGNVGAGWVNTNVADEISGAQIATLGDTNVVGGGQIGCDYQFATNWVVGVQGMVDASALKSSANSIPLGPLTLNGNIPWFATATARIGYVPAPNWMLYAKGGGAWTHTNSSLTLTGVGTVVDSVGFDQSGWTAGGGAEWRFAANWSLFAEYDYIGLTDKVVSFPNSNNIGNVHTNLQVFLVGVNLRFGGM